MGLKHTFSDYVAHYVPPSMGRGPVVFGMHPVGIGVTLVYTLSCEPVVEFLPNVHGYIIGHNKICFDFGDLDLIFKVTAVEKLKIQGGETSVFSENTVTNLD